MKIKQDRRSGSRISAPFAYTRILGQRPLTSGPDVDAWNDALGTFVVVFGPPEIDLNGHHVIVFWNFVNRAGRKAEMYSCYASIPVHIRLTTDLQIDVAIAGGRGANRFALSFIDRHIAVEKSKLPPLFLVESGPIGAIQTWAKAKHQFAANV